jgi:hypothetical protein
MIRDRCSCQFELKDEEIYIVATVLQHYIERILGGRLILPAVWVFSRPMWPAGIFRAVGLQGCIARDVYSGIGLS